MKKMPMFVLIAAAIACVVLWQCSAPRIVLETQNIDLGKVFPNDFSQTRIKVKNFGIFPLEIRKISTSCSCTGTTIKHAILPFLADEDLEIRVQVKALPGPLEEQIVIETNDLKKPVVVVSIKGIIEPVIKLQPSCFDIGNVGYSSLPIDGVILISSADNNPLPNDLTVLTDRSYITGTLEKHDTSREYLLHIRIDSSISSGPITAQVVLTSPILGLQRLVIPVRGRVVANARAIPETIYFGTFSSESQRKSDNSRQVVHLEGIEKYTVEILPAKYSELIDVECRGADMVVTLKAKKLTSDINGVISVKPLLTSFAQIEIPFHALFR